MCVCARVSCRCAYERSELTDARARPQVIARIRFSDLKELSKKWGADNLPEMHGGSKRKPTSEWVRERLAAFPKMGLPDYV